MKITLSRRLAVCAGFVCPGERVADIGCDHGYLAIHLLLNGAASSVIAADIKEGPLQSAIRNAEKFGVREKIEFCLSDGVQSIPRDFDVMVCAGMGGDTMISILEAAPWLKSNAYRLILQCQSKTPLLRKYLSEQGWRITEESVIRDGRFLYTVMEACWQPDYPRLTAAECYFPPALLENPSEDVPAYYRWVAEGLRLRAAHQPEPAAALAELEAIAGDPALNWLKEKSV